MLSSPASPPGRGTTRVPPTTCASSCSPPAAALPATSATASSPRWWPSPMPRSWTGRQPKVTWPRNSGRPPHVPPRQEVVHVVFTDAEREFLSSARLGRIATVSRGGDPDVAPVGFRVDEQGDFLVGGLDNAKTLKYHNAKSSGRAAIVVDE